MTPARPLELFVSVVAPVHDAGDILAPFVHEVVAVLREKYERWELILVDDASTDGTAATIDRLLGEVESLRTIRLSRHFGTEIAISAGLESAIGDFVVVMEPETDPPGQIAQMVEQSRQGVAMVFGIRRTRRGQPLFLRLGAPLFFWFCNRVLGLGLPRNSTHFRVLSRQAVNAVLQIRDRNRYLRTLGALVGYRNSRVEYDPVERRTNRRNKSLVESVKIAVAIVVSNSLAPLWLAAGLGMLVAALNGAWLVYVAAVALFGPSVGSGWANQSALMALMFGSVSVVLSVLCMYLARLLEESGQRPQFFIEDERISALRPPEEINVVSESTRGPKP